jgi:hypothetical protein
MDLHGMKKGEAMKRDGKGELHFREQLDARVRTPTPVEIPAEPPAAPLSLVDCGDINPDMPITYQVLLAAIDMVVCDLVGPINGDVASLRLTNAQLKSELAAAQSKIGELAFVVDRLRVENRGPPGERGPMGRDGRDGERGPPGPRGNRGQKSEICAWRIDVANYRAVPIFQDDTEGAALNLSALFEAYNTAVEGDD